MSARRPLHSGQKFQLSGHKLIQIMLIGLVLYVVIAGFSGLTQSMHALQHARLDVAAIALCLIALSYVAAGITYCLLAAQPVPFFGTILVQVAGGLVNRLLPAGLGGLGLNALYLKRHGHTVAVATMIVSLNNMLGFVGNMLLLTITVWGSSLALMHVSLPTIPWPIVVGVSGLIIVGALFIVIRFRVNAPVYKALGQVAQYLAQAARAPWHSLGALLSSCMVTALHATALYCVLVSLHFSAAWPVALVAISVGAFTGAAVPTPGGLGGAEAGIATTLMAFSVSSAAAVTAALVYRGMTYWIPLLPGYVALRIVEKRYL